MPPSPPMRAPTFNGVSAEEGEEAHGEGRSHEEAEVAEHQPVGVAALSRMLGIDKSAMDIVTSPLVGDAAKSFLRDKARVDDKHIIFLPCGDYTQPTPNVDLSADETIRSNLKAFVEAGGRLYVTDWHYDFINRTFPGHITWAGASDVPCSGCEKLAYDAAAEVADTRKARLRALADRLDPPAPAAG